MKDQTSAWCAEVINTKLHLQMISANMTHQVIPYFKLIKFQKFFENVKAFAGRELQNSKQLLGLFEKINDLNTDLITLNETHWKILDMQPDSRVVEFRDETLQLE